MRNAQRSCLAAMAMAFSVSFSGPASAETSQLRPAVYQPANPETSTPRNSILQCVPYARQISGIQIFGDAHSWWDQADGVYIRGVTPRAGAVLAFRSSGAMPGGHVATVSRVINSREILLDHANWSSPGLIERDVHAVDVSPANDWSDVRVWYGPGNQLGTRSNPAYGFIYPDRTQTAPRMYMASKQPSTGPRQTISRAPAVVTRPQPRTVPLPTPPRDDIFIVEYLDDAGRIISSANTQ